MKTVFKISVLGFCSAMLLLFDVASLHVVPEAQAQYGTRRRMRRRTARRTAIVVSSAESSQTQQAKQEAAAADQRADAAEKEAAASKAEADAAKQQAAATPPPPAAAPLPIGTVVTALPEGCTATTSEGVEYYKCGSDYYRAAFQGSQLVYVTAAPP